MFVYILGRQFDKYGNLKQWWNNRTIAEFRGAAQCIIDQYDNYTLDPYHLQIDGRLTQGENIADNGGLKQAYRVKFINVTNSERGYIKINIRVNGKIVNCINFQR